MTRYSAIWLLLGTIALAGAVSGQRRLEGEKRTIHRAIIEVTAEAAPQWEAVLNNIENLQKAFAPEPTEIEVVAHGKGLAMLRKDDTPLYERMQKFAAAGVRFAACENTMRRLKVSRSDLFDFVTTVDSGVAEIVRKQEAGWAYLKGGG